MQKVTADMAKSLSRLIKYPSFQTAAEEGAPFGKAARACLDEFLSLARSFGFETLNYDGYAGEARFGEGEGFAVLCHLDVVPAGDGWSFDAFGGEIDEKAQVVRGRGAVDDKGPAVAALYAMKALKDEGFKPRRTIKLIVGCNEESGWKCIEYYKAHAELPEEGFSPDADFPVIYAEKGILHARLFFPANGCSGLKGGGATNMVCDYCEADCPADMPEITGSRVEIRGGKIVAHGKSAHGSTPEKGINAIEPVLAALGLERVRRLLFCDGFGLKSERDDSGNLTFSPNVAGQKGGEIFFDCDIRYPVTCPPSKIYAAFEREGVKYEILHGQDPLYAGKDSPLVRELLAVYNEVTGKNASPAAIGGGTYARALKRGVAFGPEEEGDEDVVHRPDEYITFGKLEKCYNIYKLALKRLTEK